MKILINISDSWTHRHLRYSMITAYSRDKQYTCKVGFDAGMLLRRIGTPNNIEEDLLFVSMVVYHIDKLVPRETGVDGWSRIFEVNIPVLAPDIWNTSKEILVRALNFLTGDKWSFKFSERKLELFQPIKRRSSKYPAIGACNVGGISLFSGGLDSLIGVINLLENTEGTVIGVAHHDKSGGDCAAQDRLLSYLNQEYPGRLQTVQIFCGPQVCDKLDTSLRSRSFLFLGLGVSCSSMMGLSEMTMPENGMIALNPPLTPSRRGSCSTRTAHPHFLKLFNELVLNLGIMVVATNPYGLMTKGEMTKACNNLQLLSLVADKSVSCGKRGRFRTYLPNVPSGAHGCGCCVPCLYRRAALYCLGIDNEPYGIDITTENLDASKGYSFDFRDMLSFICSDIDDQHMRRLLLTSSPFIDSEITDYVALIQRGRAEVREWLRGKASNNKLRQWGI